MNPTCDYVDEDAKKPKRCGATARFRLIPPDGTEDDPVHSCDEHFIFYAVIGTHVTDLDAPADAEPAPLIPG